jgi:pimeloyl-ACP methyl ester carboxylesterase
MPPVIDWNYAVDSNGVATQEFSMAENDNRNITGAVWLPSKSSDTNTLMCFGHGASGNRYQAPICDLAGRFVNDGIPVLSIDGPVHGLRQVGNGGREAFWSEYRRDGCLTDMTNDWTQSIDAVRKLDGMNAPKIAFFGLSMGTILGIPLIASRNDVTVATLGLFGSQEGAPHHNEQMTDANKIDCPLLFLMQLDDELFTREGYLDVFDSFASNDKRIHANPGLHPEVPGQEILFAYDFLMSHITGRPMSQAAKTIAE